MANAPDGWQPAPPRGDEVRTPPHNDEAERSLLGAIFLDNRVLDEVSAIVQPEDLYREGHRHVYRSMLTLHLRGDAIDVITLADHLHAEGLLDAVGGPNFLARLSNEVPSAANVTYYATIVSRKASLRNFITTAHALIDECYSDVSDFEAFMDQAESKLFAITQSGAKKNYATMREVIKEAFAQIEALYQKSEQVTGVPSGFIDLDEITAGWQPSDLVIVAARPAMGKTALTLNMAAHAAIERKIPVAFFSLEMSNVQLAIRMLCSEARVDQSKLRTGRMSEQEWARLIKAAGTLGEAPIFLDDTPALPIMEFRSKARLLKAEHDIGIIFIDYLQLMKARGANVGSREQEISEISRNLKGIAKELNIPVIALAQLNRGVESRADKRPMNSDLRECVTGDTLVQLADGRRLPIEELVGQRPEVWAIDEHGQLVAAVSDSVWKVGAREVFRVTLRSGRTLRATAKHRLRTLTGWARLRELGVGDRVAIARAVPEPSECVSWPDEHVQLLGQMIGDGSYLKGQPMRYTSASSENLETVEQAARSFGCTVKRYGRDGWTQLLISGNGTRWKPAGVNGWLRQLGVFNQRSHERRVPQEAFRLSNKQIALLLRHMWAADGCIWVRKTQREMARRRGTAYGGSAHFAFAPSRDVLMSYADILQDEELRRMATSDLFWDEIVAIEPCGEEDVYDLTVPGPASWIANDGIVSHNSGAIEQDADIISFIYRDEVYNPESEHKGLAEFILGKHRNGGLGTVRLRFFGQFTRFENLAPDMQVDGGAI